jgi:hypothetical protein
MLIQAIGKNPWFRGSMRELTGPKRKENHELKCDDEAGKQTRAIGGIW